MERHVSGAVGSIAVVLRAGKHEKLRSKMRTRASGPETYLQARTQDDW